LYRKRKTKPYPASKRDQNNSEPSWPDQSVGELYKDRKVAVAVVKNVSNGEIIAEG